MAARLSDRVTTLRPSATVEMTERVRAARAAGRRILSLASGDPQIETDPRIIEAAHKAMLDGETRYGPAMGQPRLRQAVVDREAGRSGCRYAVEDILITPGGKFALLTALMAIASPGDEVIIPSPGWVSYGPCVNLCGATAVELGVLDRIDLDRLAAVTTSHTVAIIINSPINPTGRVLPEDEIRGLFAFARERNLWIIFDQVYSDLVYDRRFPAIQGLDGGQERTFVVDSFSKTFGMTGWRLGYLAMPSGLSKPVSRFMQHSVYCVPGFIQTAGVKALELQDELVPGYRERFRRRQLRVAERLSAVPGISCDLPGGSFYLFPRIGGDDAAIAARWLDKFDVATVPGSAFGPLGKGHLRLSVTSSDAEIDEALTRIATAMANS